MPSNLRFLQNFYEISQLILLRIVDLCLETSSHFKYYFGFLVEEYFEIGHTCALIPGVDDIR